MNEAKTRAEHIAPLLSAASSGAAQNHFVDINKMVWRCEQSIGARYMQEEAVVRKFRTTGATVARYATVQSEVAKPLQKLKKLKPPKP